MKRAKKPYIVNVRVSEERHERLRRAASMPGLPNYSVSVTSIIERGIDLACEELEQHKERQT
jgi:predicted DNA binding CopG/RHH family protein